MKRIAVVGSLNDDTVVRVRRFPQPGETLTASLLSHFPGGKGGNQAYAAARLGDPARITVAMFGQVGADRTGTWLRDNLARAQVEVEHVLHDADAPSGTAVIYLDERGQNQIVVVAGANGTFSPARLDERATALATADIVLLQLEIPLATVERAAELAHERGATVILDPAPAQPLSDALLSQADVLTPNETELCTLLGQPPPSAPLTRSQARDGAQRLLARGARAVLVKLGGNGALFLGASGEHDFAPFPVIPVDTTAAGDVFNAAFAVAVGEGRTIPEAGRFACAAAAISVTRAGAQPSVPTRAEVLLRAGLS